MSADHDLTDRSARPGGHAFRHFGWLLALGLVVVVLAVRLLDRDQPRPRIIIDGPCPPQPTAILPFDPADGAQLAAHATDIFVGRVVDEIGGGAPAVPIPGALPAVQMRHLLVEVLETEKGSATGTVVMHQSIERGDRGCLRGILGDSPVEVGAVRRFVAVRDGPTGSYSLIAGPYSHERVEDPLGAATPQLAPAATAAP